MIGLRLRSLGLGPRLKLGFQQLTPFANQKNQDVFYMACRVIIVVILWAVMVSYAFVR